MEKPGYRENLEALLTLFPGRVTITPKEAAKVMNANIKTVYSAITRRVNPLPSLNLSKKKIVIPITAFAKWLS